MLFLTKPVFFTLKAFVCADNGGDNDELGRESTNAVHYIRQPFWASHISLPDLFIIHSRVVIKIDVKCNIVYPLCSW